MKHLLTGLLVPLMFATGTAQAQSYPGDLEVFRPDGMKIKLLSRVDGPNRENYYLYGEPDHTRGCTGHISDSEMHVGKPQSMWQLGTVLGKEHSAKNINEYRRSSIMWDGDGIPYRVQLPTIQEMQGLRGWHGGIPGSWTRQCGYGNVTVLQNGSEFWTATWYWNDHRTYSLDSGQHRGRWDTDSWAVALKVLKVDASQVCVFEDHEYDGQHKCYGTGDYHWLDHLNDKMSSIIVGKNCSARVYVDGDFSGRSFIYNERRKSAEPWFAVGSMNDKASSLKVRCGEESTVGDSEVCLFDHADQQGNVMCLGTGLRTNVSYYPDGASAQEAISSLVVGKNCSVTLYEHNDYRGAKVTHSAKSLGKALKVNSLGDFNDKTSSIQVECS